MPLLEQQLCLLQQTSSALFCGGRLCRSNSKSLAADAPTPLQPLQPAIRFRLIRSTTLANRSANTQRASGKISGLGEDDQTVETRLL